MTQPALTPSQTVGPFFHDAMLREAMNVLAGPAAAGERIRIEGTVYDGDGAPVPDAVIELWQANSHGRYQHPGDDRPLPLDLDFTGFGRAGTDQDGRFWFETIKPGAAPFDATTMQAPHISVTVFARGLLNHLTTRLYFTGDPANDADPILQRVPPDRRATLLARPATTAGQTTYRFDIVLQGEGERADGETVFFAFTQ
ncbi:MAG TPA: protocatechuate 3,4-dioxygenase subunit alpha [Thermomicrobiales bacterium]|nr:protocatechuate 3,4-dioxygenase subunit alpha [Thermomicrobiales bacterium]